MSAFLIACDSAHPRRLRRVARTRERHAVRCQYAVFLFHGDATALAALLAELATLARVRQQRVFADARHRRDWARRVVAGKLDAMTAAARHYQRHGAASAGPVWTALADLQARLPDTATADQVRGCEGAASAAWFAFLGGRFAPPWTFRGRTRRPPTDPVDALLSLGYTWLLNRTIARAEAAGHAIYLGGLPDYRPGRPSLGCDLIEPLRIPAMDRWVLKVGGRSEAAPGDFVAEENGGFRLQSAAFGRILQSWESHWEAAALDGALQSWIDALAAFLRERDQPEPTEAATPTDL